MPEIENIENIEEYPTLYENDKYIAVKDDWNKITDLMLGLASCMKQPKYLWYHEVEQEERQHTAETKKNAKLDRELREKQTQYVNHLYKARHRLSSLFIKYGLDLSEIKDIFTDDELKNINGRNETIEELIKSLFIDYITYGTCYCLVDKYTNEVKTLADEQERKNRPFMVRIPPLLLKDWHDSDTGEYVLFRYEFELLEARTNLTQEPKLYRYTSIYRFEDISENDRKFIIETYISVNEEKDIISYHPSCKTDEDTTHFGWKLISSKEVEGVKQSPLSTTTIKKAWLADVVPIALKVYNKDSNKDNILYHQGYQKTWVTGTSEAMLDDDGNLISDADKQIMMGCNTIVTLPEGANVIELPPCYPQALMEDLEEDKLDIYRTAYNIDRQVKSDSRVGESAESQQEKKESLLTMIEESRKTLLDVINHAVQNFAFYKNVKLDKDAKIGKIKFKRALTELDVKDLTDFLGRNGSRLDIYPKVKKAFDKRLLVEVNMEDEELINEIEATEIETLDNIRAERDEKLKKILTNNADTKGNISKGNNRKR